MNEFNKLQVEYARVNGEFIGFCKGLLFWELQEELDDIIKDQINKLESDYQKQHI